MSWRLGADEPVPPGLVFVTASRPTATPGSTSFGDLPAIPPLRRRPLNGGLAFFLTLILRPELGTGRRLHEHVRSPLRAIGATSFLYMRAPQDISGRGVRGRVAGRRGVRLLMEVPRRLQLKGLGRRAVVRAVHGVRLLPRSSRLVGADTDVGPRELRRHLVRVRVLQGRREAALGALGELDRISEQVEPRERVARAATLRKVRRHDLGHDRPVVGLAHLPCNSRLRG